MDDLIAFIKARLDEDEAAANAGARRVGMPWRAEPQPGTPGGLVLDELGLVGSTGGRYAAEHIARHDPARVLREIEAKRAILALHRQVEAGRGPEDTGCETCHWDSDCEAVIGTGDWCATVRQLGTEFAGLPGYRAEWKPVQNPMTFDPPGVP